MKTPALSAAAASVLLLAASSISPAAAQNFLQAPFDVAGLAPLHGNAAASAGNPGDVSNHPEPGSDGAAPGLAKPEPVGGPVYYKPFLSYALSFRIGSGGIGGEIATPLGHKLDLRVGAQAFDYSTSILTNGITADAELTLQNEYLAVDYFPFRRSGFHISPGLTVHNDNHLAATLFVPGGQSLTLGDVDYVSSNSDPVTGTTHIFFGNTVAPRITLGFGNMFPRGGGHWSFPTDFGFEYTAYPTMQLSLAGSACSDMGCGPIDAPDNQANIEAERQKIVNDLAPLRFYPILSFGVSYRIGRNK